MIKNNLFPAYPLARKLLIYKVEMRISILTLLIMLMPAVTIAESIPKQEKPYGGTLVWGTRNKPSIINPLFTTSSVSMSLQDLIFNRLVRINSKGEIEPDLAESWDISPDGLVYTFHLRKGVRFHDGVECTAYDVKFTYDKIVDPIVGSQFRPLFEMVKDFRASDDYTFQVILRKPYVAFIYRLVREIIPKHLLERADLKTCYFNFHPVGTGPFKFKDWSGDNQIILEYNPTYFEGRPYLDKIMVKVYPDSRSLWTGLMRGDVDYTTFIEREDYEVIKSDPSFKSYAVPVDIYYAIFFNTADTLFSDKRMREAVTYGIDRKDLIERVAHGYGVECSGPFYPQCFGFNPQVFPYEYNPKKSQALLKEAGWKDEDNDGILEKEGEELNLKVLVDSRSDIFNRIIMVIRQQLQEIGVKTEIDLYDSEELLNEKALKQIKAQAHLKLFLGGRTDDIEEEWSSKSQRSGKFWIYRSEEVDRLFDSGAVTQNREEKQEIYRKIHKLIYQDQPACFLYFPFVFHVVSSKFENTKEYFTLSMPTYTMKDWYIEEKSFLTERR